MLKASTLVEVIIANILIVISIGLGVLIFLNITKSAFNSSNSTCQLVGNSYVQYTIANGLFNDETLQQGKMVLKRKMTQLPRFAGTLKVLEVDILNQDDKIMFSDKRIVIANE